MGKERISVFQAITLMLGTAALVVAIMEYLKEPPPPAKTDIVLENFNAIDLSGMEFVASKGTDESGKAAKMVVSVLSKEFNWSLGSTETVELSGKKTNYVEYIGSPRFITAFNECSDIIVLGMASKEGKQKTEEKRAYDRGIQLIVWLRQLINENPSLYLLNMGQYQGENNLESTFQRRIVLICIFEKDEDVDIRSALYASLIGNKAFNFPLRDYSRFGDIYNLEQVR